MRPIKGCFIVILLIIQSTDLYKPWHEFMEEIRPLIPLLAPLLIIQLALLAVAVIDLIRRDNVRYLPKWAWAVIIFLISWIGPISYLIIGRDEE